MTAAWTREALGILPPALATAPFLSHEQRRLEEQDRNESLRYMETQHWYLLEEVALQRLVDTEGAASKDAKWCARNLNLDMLLVRIDPQRGSRPLVAIEFDGEHHDAPEQKCKDVRKDVILRQLGVTLLRVNYRHMPKPKYFDAAASEPLRRVVATLAVRASRRLIERQEVLEQARNRLQTLDPLARALHGKGWFELDDDDKDDVLTAAQAADADLLLPSAVVAAQAEDDTDRRAWLSRLGVREEALLDFTMESHAGSGWSAQAVYVTPSRTQLQLVSPTLHLHLPRAHPEAIAELARGLLRDLLLEQAHRALNPV